MMVSRGRGGIGRRAGLRSPWGNPYRFDSCRPHLQNREWKRAMVSRQQAMSNGEWGDEAASAVRFSFPMTHFQSPSPLQDSPNIFSATGRNRHANRLYPLDGGTQVLSRRGNPFTQKRPRRTSRAGWACRALATGFFCCVPRCPVSRALATQKKTIRVGRSCDNLHPRIA